VKILVVAEPVSGVVQDPAWELVAAARTLADALTVALIGRATPGVAQSLAVAGVEQVVCVSTDSDAYEGDTFRDALAAVIEDVQPDLVLLSFEVNAFESGPAVAAKGGFALATDVFALKLHAGELVATRGYYGGKVHGDLRFPAGSRVMLLLRKGVWAPAREPGNARVRLLEPKVLRRRTRHLEFLDPAPDDQADITAADFLLCVGRGIGEEQNLPRFEELARKMGAVLAVSRPIVDAGWMPRSRQVGQSGRTVKPKVYLSLGVSGAVQHLAGMKTAGTIISINTDGEASIFQVAHFGSTVDLFEFADAIEKHY
jgi:electron transfer flavoprotein alpha subunit